MSYPHFDYNGLPVSPEAALKKVRLHLGMNTAQGRGFAASLDTGGVCLFEGCRSVDESADAFMSMERSHVTDEELDRLINWGKHLDDSTKAKASSGVAPAPVPVRAILPSGNRSISPELQALFERDTSTAANSMPC